MSFVVDPARNYAVLTGDVVGSSSLDTKTRRALHDALVNINQPLQTVFGADGIPFAIDIFRGDSWQLLVTDPAVACAVSIFIRAALQHLMDGVDTRVAIGIGTIDFIPASRVSEGEGEAFQRSGAGLESMHKRRRMTIDVDHGSRDGLEAIVVLCDAIVQHQWTPARARAVFGVMHGWTQNQIAANLWSPPIAQPVVSDHLDQASWDAIEQALDAFSKTLSQNIAKYDYK